MDVTERANKYADGKANEAITTAIALAYMDGYRDGYKDREEEIPVDLRGNKTEYVDLGLPSGTQWSADYEEEDGGILRLPYGKASNFKLPTKEQWEELDKECAWIQIKDQYGRFKHFECVGPNGAIIKFHTTGYYQGSKFEETDNIYAWMESESNDNCVRIRANNGLPCMTMSTWEFFTGSLLPVRQVR